jgi:hypothetical protein
MKTKQETDYRHKRAKKQNKIWKKTSILKLTYQHRLKKRISLTQEMLKRANEKGLFGKQNKNATSASTA